MASSDPVAFNLFYHQAVDDIGKGKIPCGDNLTELRSLKAQGKKKEVRFDVWESHRQDDVCSCLVFRLGSLTGWISHRGLPSLSMRCKEDWSREGSH